MAPRNEGDQPRGFDRRGFIGLGVTVAGALSLGPVLTACGASGTGSAGGSGKDLRLGFGFGSTQVDVYKPIIKGAKEEAAKRGWQILESSANNEAARQVTDLTTWIGQGVDALVILPLDEKAVAPLVDKAHDADIVVVGYAAPIPNQDGFATFDHLQGAAVVGEYVAKWINENLGGEAEVAFLTEDTVEVGRQRIGGAEAKLKELAPNAKIVARAEAVAAQPAYEATQTILQAHPNLNVMLTIADDGCLGARQAFAQAGRNPDEVLIGGWDGTKGVLEKIRENDMIRVCGALDLEAIGRSIVWIPDNIVKGDEPTTISHPYTLVTAETPDVADRLINAYL